MNRKNLTVETLAIATRIRFEGNRATGCRLPPRRTRAALASMPARSSCAAARSTRPSCCSSSGIGNPDAPRAARRTRWCTTCRGRREPPGPPRGLHPVRLASSPVSIVAGLKLAQPPRHRLRVAVPAPRHRRVQPLRGRRVRRVSNDDVDWPNLMFHFLPIAIRYDGSAARPDASHGYQVHIGPMYADTRGWVTHRRARDPKRAPEDAVQLPLHGQRPPRVGRGGPGRARHPQPAGVRALQRRRAVARARRWRPTQEILDWVRKDAETALHPSCTAKMGVDDDVGDRPRLDAGARPRRAPGRRRERRSPTSPTATSTPP